MEADFRPALVQVAETRNKRSVLATEIIKGVLLPQVFVLPLALLLVWLALTRGIKPLHQLEERIRRRKPGDLSPLDNKAVPIEVAPLVESVNDLLDRLHDSVATQKRFLADAAHQLKTPLAGLRMQADLAQRGSTSTEELKKSLLQIGRASVRATHAVNQLLALARAEGGAATLQREHVNLAEIVIEAVHDSVPHALEKHIDLGYDGASVEDIHARLEGNATLLAELVRNLLDNAINYTPSSRNQPGVVTRASSPTRSARSCSCRWKTPGRGFPHPNGNSFSSPFTARWATRPTARAWVCPSCARSPASTARRSRSMRCNPGRRSRARASPFALLRWRCHRGCRSHSPVRPTCRAAGACRPS